MDVAGILERLKVVAGGAILGCGGLLFSEFLILRLILRLLLKLKQR